jgi:electron transfer flavoprotein alpha subunit
MASDGCADIITINHVIDAGISIYVSNELTVSERPDLGAANVIGASRAAVDAGFVPNDCK